MVVAANAEDDTRVASESADLLYHLLVLLQARGVSLDAVLASWRIEPSEPLVRHGLRPPPHPQRILPARRGQPDLRSGGPRQEARHGQPRGHRPREHARRLELLRGGQGPGHPADPRVRGLPRLRPAASPRKARVGARGIQPSGAAGEEPRRLPATSSGSPRSASPRGSTGGPGSTRKCWRSTPRASSAWRPVSPARWRCTCGRAGTRRRRRARSGSPSTFGNDGFWLEIQQHGIAEERLVTEGMLRLGQELGLGVVATNDAHYLRREDAEAHDVLLAIGTGSDLDDPKRFRFTGQESYVKSESEMRALFPDHPETLDNTQAVADLCEFDFEKKYFLPELPPPRRVRQRRSAAGAPRRARAPSARYGAPLPAEVGRAAGVRAGRHQHGGLRRLLPHRAGLHRRGAGPRHSGRPGPRLGRGLARRLRARHHQRLTRSSSTSCSSGSSIPSGCRCPTSTWTSASSAGAR